MGAWSPPPLIGIAPGPIYSLPPYLFHYTDEAGMQSIFRQRLIRKSLPAQVKCNAQFGEGVYLTAIQPDAPNYVLMSNNWSMCGRAPSPNMWHGSKIAKLQYCFIIPTMSLHPSALCRIWDKFGRNIWVYRGIIFVGDGTCVYACRRW